MASTQLGSPNILKDIGYFADRGSNHGDSCHQVHVRIYWSSVHNSLQAIREKNQEEINQVIWGEHVKGLPGSIHQRPNKQYPALVLCRIHVQTGSVAHEGTLGNLVCLIGNLSLYNHTTAGPFPFARPYTK
ncbi:hypothetical protein AVEN_205357-1 [Araneus ventricosus]|uniref:Uncharacterized protein n=1 Tax=Araneus ventricosus TaxID=182803 RepID=A0A4Y2VCN1_ARAVE|nr:hypothetical protein AVEN_205357-1 [Araneus ventricosus]